MSGTKANLRPKQLPWGGNSTSVSHVFLAGNLGLSVASDPAADGDRADVVAGVREHDVDGGPLHGRLRSGRKKEAEKSAGANLLKSVFPHQSSGRTHIFWEDLTSLQEDPHLQPFEIWDRRPSPPGLPTKQSIKNKICYFGWVTTNLWLLPVRPIF